MLLRAAVCALLLALAGCAGLPASNKAVQVSELNLAQSDGSTVTVQRFAPISGTPRAALIFAHGFLRGPARHEDLARALASERILVLLPQFANPLIQGSLQRDAAVIQALHREAASEVRMVLWGGFSRGGTVVAEALASLPAEVSRPAALLMLDPVWSERGARVLASASIPLRIFAAPAASCNARGRALAWPVAARFAADLIPAATHCDAESPSDFLCSIACGGADAGRQRQFLDASLNFVRKVVAGSNTSAAPLGYAARSLAHSNKVAFESARAHQPEPQPQSAP